ncbi:hypothetical protein F5890DRAFT_1477903 [Lentinula detonsa]|uniref:C2H2-type domain-containing protein n=1 Tax=Lentinula detonsa TaxID=2804962 RepID=A0AA38PS02_9AGAR|nr:hypothetical protein F5890DRAFT_1477903 [Lentinula detonsa]
MHFEEFPCPLCPETLRTAELMYDHVVRHRESSRAIVRASIHDRDILIAKVSSLDFLYACPLCSVSGPLGAVCLHYLNTHASSPSSKSPIPGSTRDYPSKRKRSLSPARFSLSSPSPSSSFSSSLSQPLPPSYPCPNSPKLPAHLKRALLPACTIEINISAAISSHPTPEKFFGYVGFSLGNVISTCPFEAIMHGSSSMGHSFMWRCPLARSSGCVDRFKAWKRMLVFPAFSNCLRCGCPQRSSFGGHPDCAPCVKDERESWKSWLLSLPFLIYETRALRGPIFRFLGLQDDSFSTVKEYAGWIVTRAIPLEEQATNLILIVYVYFLLQSKAPSSSPLSVV